MTDTRSLVLGAGLGVGGMYLFDPVNGHRRRALVRDQRVHAGRLVRRFAEQAWCDLRLRVGGGWHELQTRWEDASAPKRVLAERVRAKVGRHVHHAREVKVTVEREGQVVLRGKVAPAERQPLLAALRKVPGVKTIDDGLELAHFDEKPLLLPALRRRLTPATRALGAVATGIAVAAVATGRLRR